MFTTFWEISYYYNYQLLCYYVNLTNNLGCKNTYGYVEFNKMNLVPCFRYKKRQHQQQRQSIVHVKESPHSGLHTEQMTRILI